MKRRGLSLLVVLAVACAGSGVLFGPDPLWALQSGGPGTDRGWGVAAFEDYSGVTIGNFAESITIGPGQSNETTLTSLGGNDVFAARHGYDGRIDWVRHVGGAGEIMPGGVDRFRDGSFVLAGSFEQTVTVGVGRTDAANLMSAGAADLFVIRYRENGSLAWAKRAGGTGSESCRGISTSSDGSCVVTGYYQDSITFGPGEANETTLTNGGQTETFLARYNADGTLAWARKVAGDATCTGNDVAAFDDGSCVAAVRVEGTITFGAGEANETVLESAGGTDVALARFGPDGSLVWALRVGAGDGDTPWGVATFPHGGCVVTGAFSDQVVFGEGGLYETTLTAAGEVDIFVARYNALGKLDWAARAGGAMQDVARDVASFPDGSCVITGRMRDVATFGPGDPAETVLTSNGEADIFVARYGPDGLLDWAENVGGTLTDQGESVCGCPDGSLFVTGRFQETVTFHEGDSGETTLVSVGGQDVFVAHYTEDGS